jgi:hypothetical protein
MHHDTRRASAQARSVRSAATRRAARAVIGAVGVSSFTTAPARSP